MICHRLNSVLENLVAACHKVLLADCWEALTIGKTFSVEVLLAVFGDVISMSEWHNDFLETCLFAGHHGGISVLDALVEAQVI